MTRDVWRVTRPGSLGALKRQTELLPPPAAGEARVRVSAIGLNFADVFACLGLYSATPKGPFIPGLEFAGVIEEVAPPAEGIIDEAAVPRAGDPVFGVTRFGGYVTHLNALLDRLAPIPAGWSAAQAASFPVQGLTAWYGLIELARLQSGELVLLQSAAGGVGLSALSILRSVGARTIATVGREAKRRFLIDRFGLAPDVVIVRDRRHFDRQLDRALAAVEADGFDCVFDAVAGPFLEPSLRRLRPRGRFVVYGAADMMPRGRLAFDPRPIVRYLRRARIDPLSLIANNRSVMGFNLIWLWDQAPRLRDASREILAMYSAPPLVGRCFTFGEVPAAMRFLQSGESIGKIVVTTT